jgi:hypothetical protein
MLPASMYVHNVGIHSVVLLLGLILTIVLLGKVR